LPYKAGIYRTDDGKGGNETIEFTPVKTRLLRLRGFERGTVYGYSLWELKVFGRQNSL